MKRALGPIVTTGVALVVAGVIVANPVIAPRADVQIPAIKLSSGTDETGGMLDQAFLNAIAPAPPESTNPFSVLKQLISSLAADASYLGKNALVDAFVAGVTAVSEPELTAAWSPYVAPAPTLSPLAASVLPGINFPQPAASESNVPVALPDPSALVNVGVPAVQQFVSSIVHDVGYVSTELVSAAFAAGQLVATEPAMIAATLRALVNGDLTGAINNAVKAVIAPLGPPAIIVDALRTVVETHLSGFTAPAPEGASSVDPSPVVTASVPRPSAVTEHATRRGHDAAPAPDALVLPSTPAAAAATLDSSHIRSSASDSTSEPTSESNSAVSRKPAAATRRAAKVVGDQVADAVNGVADAVGRAVGRPGAGAQGSAPQ